MLVRIADYDAPLGDVFHAIKRALALVHRLTIVLSVDPPLETTSSITAGDAAVTGARQANSWDSNSDDSSDRHNRYSHDSDRSMDPNGMSSSSSLSSIAPSSFHSVQRLLSALYVSFTKQALALQRPLAELDIVFRESCGYPIGVGVEDQIPFDVFLGMPDGKGGQK
jgi:hypothetical protein